MEDSVPGAPCDPQPHVTGHVPLADVEDARRLDEHGLQLLAGAARLRDILQTPVPVVVVERAELGRAGAQRPPGGPVKRHAHVVFGAVPLRQLHLQGSSGVSSGQQVTQRATTPSRSGLDTGQIRFHGHVFRSDFRTEHEKLPYMLVNVWKISEKYKYNFHFQKIIK